MENVGTMDQPISSPGLTQPEPAAADLTEIEAAEGRPPAFEVEKLSI